MANIERYIKKTNLKTRILSVVLVIAILCGSFVWFGNNDMENVVADGTTKKYAEYIVDRITAGMQDNFTILEIVPYDGFGEFRYFLNESEVTDAFATTTGQELIKNNSWCATTINEWKSFEGNGFSQFGYQVRYNAISGKYEVKGNDTFQQKAFGDMAGLLEGKIKLNTVEANDLTVDDITEADLIVFTSAPHYDGTLKMYSAWSGVTDYGFVDASGNPTASGNYYEMYEKVGSDVVSRDASWEVTRALLTCTIEGRALTLSNGTGVTIKTPVILDNTETSGLDTSLNVYKFNLIYRTLCGAENIDNTALVAAYEAIVSNIETNNITSFGTTDIEVFYNSTYNSGSYKSKIEKNCFDSSHNVWLTDYFFSYAGSELLMVNSVKEENTSNKIYVEKPSSYGTPHAHYWIDGGSAFTSWPGNKMNLLSGTTYYIEIPKEANMIIFNNGSDANKTANLSIPSDGKNYYNLSTGSWSIYNSGSGDTDETDYSSGKGVTTRTGSDAYIADVMQFLLGSKSSQTPRYVYDAKLRVLEVQPCNAFNYDTFEGAKELGEKLLMSGTSSWTSSNYKNYIDVTCVTTNALNGLNNDFTADFDVIIIGDNIDILNKDDEGHTIYNDRTLNGYVYLAFGDLFKIATNALGLLPSEYAELQNSSQQSWYKALNSTNKYEFTSYVYNSLHNAGGEGKYYLHKLMQDYYKKGGVYDSDNNGYGNAGGFYSNYQLGNVRGVDNDITDITKEKLTDFAKSGKAVILADSLYNLDDYRVYPTSDIYDYCKTLAQTDAEGNRLYGVYSMDQMSGAVNHRSTLNPEITMTSQPASPTYNASGVVQIPAGNSRDINFGLNIKAAQTGTYRIKLYVDKNSDGVYKSIEDGISDDRNELYFSRDVNLTANTVKNYEIDSQLSDNFIGMLAWKIEVVKLDATGNETAFRDSVKGYSAIKNEDAKTVNVLQIMPNHNDNQPITLDMETNADFISLLGAVKSSVGYEVNVTSLHAYEFEALYNPDKGGTAYNGLAAGGRWVYFKTSWGTPYAHYYNGSGYTTTWPGEKMTKVEGNIYAVWVPEKASKVIFSNNGSNQLAETSLPADNDNNLYTGSSWTDPVRQYYENPETPKAHDYLATYDMVVIGFADMFGASGDGNTNSLVSSDISNKYGALDNIVDFIDAGKAVLFTHDTISWRVSPNYDAQRVENASAGMLEMHHSTLLKSDGTAGSNSYHDELAHDITVSLRDKVGLDKYGITLVEGDRTNNEMPMYATSSMRPNYMINAGTASLYVEELHGFTPWFYYRNNFLHSFYSEYSSDHNGYGIYSLKPFDKTTAPLPQIWDKDANYNKDYFDYNKSGAWTTTKVSMVNEGSVTMYPYDIDENLTVEKTHAQYYSINMEDEDVVVWYTLAGKKNDISSYYYYTDKDVENNYYIYSKGNITYSGAGHQVMSSLMEKKLFVNTLIKAIAGGNNTPALAVTNGGVGDGGAYYIYVNSANSAGTYDMHILAKDADLVSPEAAGINKLVRESDLPELKAKGINTDVIGTFKWGKVYWVAPDGSSEKLIHIFDEDNPLHNGVIYELPLNKTSLSSDTTNYTADLDNNGVNETYDDALAYIEALTEGVGGMAPKGAKFRIEVSDWLGATKSINVVMTKRDLFELE